MLNMTAKVLTIDNVKCHKFQAVLLPNGTKCGTGCHILVALDEAPSPAQWEKSGAPNNAEIY